MLKTVLLIMRRASLAQGLMAKVQDAPGLQLCYEPDYANADVAIRSHLATGALLEVAEDGAQDIDFCLALCAWLREVTPGPSRPSGRGRSTILYFMMCPWIIWPPVCSLCEIFQVDRNHWKWEVSPFPRL